MRKKRHSTAGPICVLVLIWVLRAALDSVLGVSGTMIAIGLSIMTAVWLNNVLHQKAAESKKSARKKTGSKKAADVKAEEAKKDSAAEKTEEEASPYSPEVQAIIREGRVALREMGRLYGSIPNVEVRKRINELMSVSDRIIRDAIDDPADVPQIRKFLDYYLPTTIRLLNSYDRMSAQEYAGENISGSMQRIEEMLDTTIAAYKKQLDALFANQAADIQTDIDVMNSMLAREGLGGKSYLDLKDFMKQYEQQQATSAEDTSTDQMMKGSTSHG